MLSPEGGVDLLRLSQMVLWEARAAGSAAPAESGASVTGEQYAAALLSAATTSNLSLAASTGKQRGLCWSEFSARMTSLQDVLQQGPSAATPADIVAYCEQHWTVQHEETLLADGTVRAAPSLLESMLSPLSGVLPPSLPLPPGRCDPCLHSGLAALPH